MKKSTTFLLTAVLLLASANVFGYTFTKNGLKYSTYAASGTTYLEITGVDPSYSGNIAINFGPISYTYNNTSYTHQCRRIASGVTFAGNTLINSISCSLTSIGDIPQACFQNCIHLNSVNLGSVDDDEFDINDYAFSNCQNLSTVTLPKELYKIGNYAFNNCAMPSMTFNNVHMISPTAFKNCSILKTIVWNNTEWLYEWDGTSPLSANSVTSKMPFTNSLKDIVTTVTVNTGVTHSVFCGMTSLKNLTFGSSVTSVGAGAFRGCTALTGWSGGENIVAFNEKAFANCTGLTKEIKMTATSSVNSYYIGEYAFYNTKVAGLTVGTMGTELTHTLYLNEHAFEECTSMTSITLHAALSSSNDNPTTAFNRCTGVTYLYWGCDSYYVPDANEFSGTGSFLSKLTNLRAIEINRKNEIFRHEFYNLTQLTQVIIGDRVTRVDDNAFYGCTGISNLYWYVPGNRNDYESSSKSPFAGSNLKSVKLGPKVTHIPAYIFANQNQLTDVYCTDTQDLPEGLETIGTKAFFGVPLTSIGLPNSLESIGAGAFYGSNITMVVINEYLTSIGEQAFVSNNGPMRIVWNARRCAFDYKNKMDGYGVFYPGDGRQSISEITFGNAVEVIPARLCYNAEKLTGIILPSSLQSIGDSAFYSCSKLHSIDSRAAVPPTLEGEYVFYGCNSSDPLGLRGFNLETPNGSLALYQAAEGWCEFYGTCENTEGIEEVPSDQVQSTKVIKNGQLYLMYKGTMYDVQGRKVNE